MVIDLNEAAYAKLSCETRLEIVPGAGHLFEEPGTLDVAIGHAGDWFVGRTGYTGEDGFELLVALSMYVITVLAGLLLYQFGVYALLKLRSRPRRPEGVIPGHRLRSSLFSQGLREGPKRGGGAGPID